MNETLTVQGASTLGTSEGDEFVIEASEVTLDAGAGDDILFVIEDDNVIDAGDGDNRVVMLSNNTTLTGGDGANEVIFNGEGNLMRFGDGSNTITGLDDQNENNSLRSGDGADIITVAGDDNWLHAGNGNDTLIVEGDGNLIYAGYPADDDEPSTVGDDDVMTVRGDDNFIDGGTGANVLDLDGRNNVYIGAGSDTIRADASKSTVTGAIDIEINGDENSITVEGGRLISNGNGSDIELTGGSTATVNGNQLMIAAENSRVQLDSDYALMVITNATVEAATTASATFLVDDELMLNGRKFKGSTILRMTDGEPISALATDTPLEGFEGVEVGIDAAIGRATIDGVTYEVSTVPAAVEPDDDVMLTVKDRAISDLSRGESLRLSKGGTYTVNGSLFELTPEDTLIGANDWAGLLLENTVDNIVFEGTVFNDQLTNYGAGVTVDGGLGVDHISLGSAEREFVVFDGESSIEVEGFATGFDGVSDVVLSEGDLRDFRFDFGISGVHVFNGGAELDMVNTGSDKVDVLLQNGGNVIKFTAVNGDATVSASGADFYALNDRATLYAGEELFAVNGVTLPEEYLIGSTVVGSSISTDYEFAEFVLTSPLVGTYTVHGISYDTVLESVDAAGQFYVFDGDATVKNYSGEGFFNGLHFATDGRATIEVVEGAPLNDESKSVKSITGIGAGEHFTLGSMVDGNYVDREYTVSADGLSIIDSDGVVQWTGSEVTTVNLMSIYEADKLKARLRQLLLPFLYDNVTTDDSGLRIDVKGMRASIATWINGLDAQLTGLTATTANEYGLVSEQTAVVNASEALTATDEYGLVSERTAGLNASEALTATDEYGLMSEQTAVQSASEALKADEYGLVSEQTAGQSASEAQTASGIIGVVDGALTDEYGLVSEQTAGLNASEALTATDEYGLVSEQTAGLNASEALTANEYGLVSEQTAGQSASEAQTTADGIIGVVDGALTDEYGLVSEQTAGQSASEAQTTADGIISVVDGR